mmetsp:Transcript_18733/g.21692  ORF Transcript_18733/g.21692 Transcript_18733/m.21692 type:complete len:87 (+) Transcript_18733:116-376(+)
MWGFLKNYPKCSSWTFVVLLIARFIHNRRAKHEKRESDTALLREKAYTYLQTHSGTAHQIVHVNDDITNEVYPNSRKQRQLLNSEI